ncbi:MAG: hypothetical protein ABI651_07580 [Verrucomicrobiota bacterium]
MEVPVSEVAEQAVSFFQTAKIQIAPSVAIHISFRDTGTIHPDLVRGRRRIARPIGERDPGDAARESRETDLPG